jgi:hypothetical protein
MSDEEKKQDASNVRNVGNVSLIFMKSKCVNLLRFVLEGKVLHFYIKVDFMPHVRSFLAELKLKNASYTAKFAYNQIVSLSKTILMNSKN